MERNTPATDITERSDEFKDFETNKLKIVVLDGESGKVTLIQAPHHGQIVIGAIKGNVRRVRFEDEYLI